MSIKRIRNGALILLIIIISGSVGFRQGRLIERRSNENIAITASGPAQVDGVDMTLFWDVWNRLNKSYLDRKAIKVKEMVYGAIKGMTAALDDPYTAFLPPSDNNRSKEDLSGEFGGVGIQLGFVDKTLGVIAPLSNTPAEKAGIKSGDLILKIKDEAKGINRETQGISLAEAMDLIRGKKGSEVILTIVRQNEGEPKEVKLVRELINIASVELKWVSTSPGVSKGDGDEGKVAWMRVYRFGDKTKQEWERAVEEVLLTSKEKQFRGIVLDLRNNPGGYLRGAVELASDFVKDGVVVQQEGRDKMEKFEVEGGVRLNKMPLVVLVNQGSASASEILAGALRERLGVKVVGEKTFGKGTVQEAQELADGAGLHVTIARWLLPSGKNIHGSGLMPDVEIKYEPKENDPEFDNQLNKAIEMLR